MAISFSPDSSKILALSKDGYDALEFPGQLYTYLLDTAAGKISSAGPVARVADVNFLHPSLANTTVRVEAGPSETPIRSLHLYSLGNGRHTVRAVGLRGEVPVDDLPAGSYIVYGYDADHRPALRQKIVVAH